MISFKFAVFEFFIYLFILIIKTESYTAVLVNLSRLSNISPILVPYTIICSE